MASRRAELAKIHIGAKELRLDEDAYRDLLYSVAGSRSSKDLDERGRRQVLKEMKRLGVEFHPAGKRKRRPKPPPEKAPLIRKIRALLAESNRPEEYAESILRRVTKHPHKVVLGWGSPEQLHKVVAALTYDQRRRKERGKSREEHHEGPAQSPVRSY